MNIQNNHSAAAHLIHSRMQLLRHRLEVTEFIQIPMLVYKYQDYFDAAAASVLKRHNIESEYRDLCEAADLLYNTFYPPPMKNDVTYYAVQHLDYRTEMWFDIKWWDKENGFKLADPDERLTMGEALYRLASMNVGKMVIFRIKAKHGPKPKGQ